MRNIESNKLSAEEVIEFLNNMTAADIYMKEEDKVYFTLNSEEVEQSEQQVEEPIKQVVPVVETIDSIIGQHLKFMDSPENVGRDMGYIVDTISKLQQFKLGWITCKEQGI
jgi:hypothetical protein